MMRNTSTTVAEKVREMVLSQLGAQPRPLPFTAKPLWAAMKRCGSDLWLDTGDMDGISDW